MAAATPHARPWKPASDDTLTWLRVGGILPSNPKPLELTGAIYAFIYGLTHALESQYFPLFELRVRTIEGQLYLSVVPSGLADRDIEARIRNVNDRTIRYRDILGGWRKDARPLVIDDMKRIEEFSVAEGTGEARHEAWFKLRRMRANQWFGPSRSVVCPTALLKSGVGQGNLDEAMQAIGEMRELVIQDGAKAFDAAIDRVGQHLAWTGNIDTAEDVIWLEFDEVSEALEAGDARFQDLVAQRKSGAAHSPEGPDVVGQPLVRDDRRLFLLPEIFELLGVSSPL